MTSDTFPSLTELSSHLSDPQISQDLYSDKSLKYLSLFSSVLTLIDKLNIDLIETIRPDLTLEESEILFPQIKSQSLSKSIFDDIVDISEPVTKLAFQTPFDPCSIFYTSLSLTEITLLLSDLQYRKLILFLESQFCCGRISYSLLQIVITSYIKYVWPVRQIKSHCETRCEERSQQDSSISRETASQQNNQEKPCSTQTSQDNSQSCEERHQNQDSRQIRRHQLRRRS